MVEDQLAAVLKMVEQDDNVYKSQKMTTKKNKKKKKKIDVPAYINSSPLEPNDC